MTAARPIRLVTASLLWSVRTAAEQAVAPWSVRWLGTGTAVGVDCRPLDPRGVRSSAGWLHCATARAEVWMPAEAQRDLIAALFGPTASARGDVASAAAHAAAADLLVQLAGDADEPGAAAVAAEAPEHLWQPGRSVVAVTLEIGAKGQGGRTTLLIEVHAKPALAATAARAALTTVRSALQDQPIQIEVSLGSVELELGALRSLAVGDVLRLDRALDAGADVRVGGERVACAGFLGASEGRRAVALARA